MSDSTWYRVVPSIIGESVCRRVVVGSKLIPATQQEIESVGAMDETHSANRKASYPCPENMLPQSARIVNTA